MFLTATFCLSFAVYCVRCAVGRPPVADNVKHNEVLGPFMARFLIWFIGPLERLLIGRVSPNAITAVSLLMCVATGASVALGHLAVGVWLYVFAGILDVLDGRLARLSNQQTPAGALFDSVSDRWGELFVLTGFAWRLHDSPWLFAVMAAIGGSMMVSYTRARAEGLGISLSGGMMQRAERILLVSGGTLIAAWFGANPQTAMLAELSLGFTMVVCGVGSSATAISRWIIGYRELVRRSGGVEAEPAAPPPPIAQPSEPTPARVLLPSVRKVAPPVAGTSVTSITSV